jgi:hypothetical protein
MPFVLTTTPYNTQTVVGKQLRFFNDSTLQGVGFVAYEDVIQALGLLDWSTRIPSSAGAMYGGLPADATPVLVAGVGLLNGILTSRATDLATYSPRIGKAQQDRQALVIAAIAAGAALAP